MAKPKKPVKKENEKKADLFVEKIGSELVRYEFSDDELQKLGARLAVDFKNVQRIDEEAKSVAKRFKSDIDAIKLGMYDIARWVREGYDMRDTECYCYKDFGDRKAYYWRADKVDLDELKADILTAGDDNFLNEPVKVRDLRVDELQREIPFEEREGEVGDPTADSDGEEEVTVS